VAGTLLAITIVRSHGERSAKTIARSFVILTRHVVRCPLEKPPPLHMFDWESSLAEQFEAKVCRHTLVSKFLLICAYKSPYLLANLKALNLVVAIEPCLGNKLEEGKSEP
jgi:hypothetical protein